jgi:hypothetical protein
VKRYSDHPGAHISMGQDPELVQILMQTVSVDGLCCAIETGTYVGTGSTTLLARAFCPQGRALGPVTTIEASWASYRAACANLAVFPHVNCRWGLSVRREEAIQFIENDPALQHHESEPDVLIDATENPRDFYLREIDGHLPGMEERAADEPLLRAPDNLLRESLAECRSGPPLVLLDSSGGIGLLEFEVVLDAMKSRPFVLVLDDTLHLKHYRSLRRIQTDSRFSLIAKGTKRDWIVAAFRPGL